ADDDVLFEDVYELCEVIGKKSFISPIEAETSWSSCTCNWCEEIPACLTKGDTSGEYAASLLSVFDLEPHQCVQVNTCNVFVPVMETNLMSDCVMCDWLAVKCLYR
ncbi:hypothetical protein IRJ41_015630, partial [Triplophysa rosa]